MKKTVIIISLVLLAACGLSRDEKQNIAINACSIMGETKKSEAIFRLQTMSDAREKIGGETYIRGDDAIIEAFELGLCQQLVMNEDYEWYRNVARNELRKREEQQRIADSKPTVKEEFFSNGQLKSRTNYQPKSDGGKYDGDRELFHENGQLKYRGKYKNGKMVGLHEHYYENGQLKKETNYTKDGKEDGLQQTYYASGEAEGGGNYKDGKMVGLHEHYYENGQLKKKTNYNKDGKEDGLQVTYYASGEPEGAGNYKDGKKEGAWVKMLVNGTISGGGCYRNGKETNMNYCERK
jgi:antitoxin component YwqK of YwqJK toxin-antitoxin module